MTLREWIGAEATAHAPEKVHDLFRMAEDATSMRCATEPGPELKDRAVPYSKFGLNFEQGSGLFSILE